MAMMFPVFLTFGFFIYWNYHRKKNTGAFLSLLVIFPFLIFSPSLQWSYLFDDIDNFYLIAQIENPAGLAQYLLSPQEGHVLLLTRILYFAGYKLFGINPLFYHILTILGMVTLSLLMYKIIFNLTQSWGAALTAGILTGWFTGCLQVMETAFSPFVFSMVFVVAVLYCVSMYSKTKKCVWIFAAALTAFISPLVFAFGILTGIWVFLFVLLCLPLNAENFGRTIRSLAPVFWAWLGGVMVYFILAKPVQSLALSGAAHHTKDALWLTLKSILLYAIPSMTAVEKLSLFCGIFFILFALMYRKNIPWRVLSFFILWLFGHYLFVFYARGYGAGDIISTERYHFPPALALFWAYSVILSIIILDPYWKYSRISRGFSALLILVAVFYAYLQYNSVLAYSRDQGELYKIARDMRAGMTEYLRVHPEGSLRLENKNNFSLGNFRYLTRKCETYVRIFLPANMYRRIVWGVSTDEEFLDFLKDKKETYPRTYAIFVLNEYLS